MERSRRGLIKGSCRGGGGGGLTKRIKYIDVSH